MILEFDLENEAEFATEFEVGKARGAVELRCSDQWGFAANAGPTVRLQRTQWCKWKGCE